MTDEKVQFRGVIERAKSKGYSKKKLIESIKSIQLDVQMRWMMTPVTDPASESLKRDYQKTIRLQNFANRNWNKLGKVI